MDAIVFRLRKILEEYKSYSDVELKNSRYYRFVADHRKDDPEYSNYNRHDDLLFAQRCETKAATYWNVYHQIRMLVEEFDTLTNLKQVQALDYKSGYNSGLDTAISLVTEMLKYSDEPGMLETVVCGLESSKKK